MVSLAEAILAEDINSIKLLLRYGEDVNQIDEYGFTPLIEAAIIENIEISKFLLEQGASANKQDVTGGTPLQWATENHNATLCKLLLTHQASPNSYNLAGQPVIVMSMLRQQNDIKRILLNAGANQRFAQDYINVKLLGHMFELVGIANILGPDKKFVEVDFEGFFLETTIGIIADSLTQFQHHFAARQLRRYGGLTEFIVEVMQRASQLMKYHQYRVDISKHRDAISLLIQQDPLIIPIGYEGHAIAFIRFGDIWVKCDRREDSRLYDNIMFYRIQNRSVLTTDFIKKLIYKKQSSDFINHELDEILGLTPLTELKVEAQISGNCSWANMEATIPALFFLILMQTNQSDQAQAYYKTLAINFFHRWREWNKDRALDHCIQQYQEGDAVQKACKAEILAAVLFQRSGSAQANDKERMEKILALLIHSPYEYLLKNYLRVYYYESYTSEGKHFSDLLKQHGFE